MQQVNEFLTEIYRDLDHALTHVYYPDRDKAIAALHDVQYKILQYRREVCGGSS